MSQPKRRKLTTVIKTAIAKQLAAQPYVMRRPGVVVTYNSGDTPKTVDITLGDSDVTIPDVRFIDSTAAWTPVAGDQVEVAVFGLGESLDMIVLGKLRG